MPDSLGEYDEYICYACKKAIKNLVVKCRRCSKRFFHPSCVSKHKVPDKNDESVPCPGPYENIAVRETMVRTPTTAGTTRDRLGSTGSVNEGRASTEQAEVKLDWIVKTVKTIKDEAVCRDEIKRIIQDIVRDEMKGVKKEMEELRGMLLGAGIGAARGPKGSYSDAMRGKPKETIIIIEPKAQQESEVTKRAIKERVDIKSMGIGVSKLKKGSKGAVILGCDTGEELDSLRATVQDKMGENFKVKKQTQPKPKLKIINIDEEELQSPDEELTSTIMTQNGLEEIGRREIKIIKRIAPGGELGRNNRERKEGTVIVEVDDMTHAELLTKGKLSIGWKKCPVFNHVNVRRCFKCWGYYHIAKNCTREEACYKCAGKHNARECTGRVNKCVNCAFKNQAFNLKLDTEHTALDRECPTFKRVMTEEKRRIGWDE